MRRSGVALRLVTICLPLLPTQHLSAEDGLLPPGPPVSWHAWAEKTKSALRQPTAQELAAAVGEVADALQAIENALDEISDGAILRRQWGLASLHNALRSQVPSLAALGTAEAQLAGRVPRSLQPVVNELHHRVAALSERATLAASPDALERCRRDVERIAAFLQAEPQSPPPSHGLPADVRDGYARLVRAGVTPAQLEPVRNAVSHPNLIVRVSAEYVAQASHRRFTVPVSFAQRQNGAELHGAGNVEMQAAAVVVPNDSRAEIRVDSRGAGAVALDAARKNASLRARDDLGVSAGQSLYLAPEGVSGERPRVNLATDLSLNGVCLNVRSRIAGKLLTPVAERIASRKLDAERGRISAEGERIVAERIADEGYDIAYRLNALFRQSYWQRLAARDIQSDLHLRSTSDGIEGWAENGHAWQLCARPAPPCSPRRRSMRKSSCTSRRSIMSPTPWPAPPSAKRCSAA